MHTISLDDLARVRREADGPVLLALLERRDGMRKRLGRISEALRDRRPDMLVCTAHPDYLEPIMRTLQVVGTPTFLLLHHDKEIGRLLGAVSEAHLLRFATATNAAGTSASAGNRRINGEGRL